MIPREPQSPNPPRIAEIRAQDMYENDYVVDCCVFCLYPPPNRPPMREKISSGVVVFLAKLLAHQTHVVLGIFELRLRCHISTGCLDVWHLLRILDSPIHSRDSWGQRSA